MLMFPSFPSISEDIIYKIMLKWQIFDKVILNSKSWSNAKKNVLIKSLYLQSYTYTSVISISFIDSFLDIPAFSSTKSTMIILVLQEHHPPITLILYVSGSNTYNK